MEQDIIALDLQGTRHLRVAPIARISVRDWTSFGSPRRSNRSSTEPVNPVSSSAVVRTSVGQGIHQIGDRAVFGVDDTRHTRQVRPDR